MRNSKSLLRSPIRYQLRTLLAAVTVLAVFFAAVSWFDLLGPTGDIFRLERISYGHASSVAFANDKLDSDDSRVRNAAILALGRIGPPARSSVPKLVEILAADMSTEAANAAWAIGNIGPTDSAASSALKNALTSKNRETRRYAAYAISCHGDTVTAAIPDLISALDDDHVAYVAARALGQMGPQGIVAIPKLTDLLSPENDARSESATSLSYLSAFSTLPNETVFRLKKLTKDSEVHVRKAASDAVTLIETYQPNSNPSNSPLTAP